MPSERTPRLDAAQRKAMIAWLKEQDKKKKKRPSAGALGTGTAEKAAAKLRGRQYRLTEMMKQAGA